MRSLSKALLLLFLFPATSRAATPQSGIESFNKALDSATRSMNNAAVLALWEEDGISLLPSTPPIVGKQAIGTFLDDVVAKLPGAKMKTFEMQCNDIQVSGDWGSEWCTEHQIVEFPDGKPPFDGWGKMLFVLHRGADGKWRAKEEMWNQAVAAH